MTALPAKIRILVIDDEDEYCVAVRDALPVAGFDVICAKDRDRALEYMTRQRADLVVLDLALSDRSDDTSGLDLLSELREKWHAIKVIVFTRVHFQPEMIVDCIKRGAYYYFIKEWFVTKPDRFMDLVVSALAYQPQHDVLEDNYPHPLALLYRDYRRNVVVPHLKFRRLIELVELLVRLTSMICLASRTSAGIAHHADLTLARPSLGRWFEFLQFAVGPTSPNTPWIESIRSILTSTNRRSISALIQLRNEWIGHGATRPDHEYTQVVEQWDSAVLDILHSASVLSVWQMFLVKSMRLLGENRYLHNVIDLSGHTPKFLSRELELISGCEADKVYLADLRTQQLLCLDPLVAVFVCEHCNQQTVFVFDKLDRERVLYLDYANGHHSARAEPYRTLHRMLG